jgi:DNA polymerase (family X)
MTNAEIAAVFSDIATLLKQKKENIFKIRAYEKVARSINELQEPVEKLAAENRLKEIIGAGEAITKKITEMVTTGKLAYYEKLKRNPPNARRHNNAVSKPPGFLRRL